MDFQKELDLLIRSRYPIIYIPTTEEQRVEQEIGELARKASPPRQVRCWDYCDGYEGNNAARNNPLQALEQIGQAPQDAPTPFVLRDFHKFMEDIAISRKLRNLARTLEGSRKTVIIVSPTLKIPYELSEDITVQDFTLPDFKEIEAALDQLIPKNRIELEAGGKEVLIKACQGLTMTRIRQVLRKALATDGVIDEKDIGLVLEVKKQIVRQRQVLEFWPAVETMDDIGGLDVLKEWLRKRASALTERARKYGAPFPTGVLLAGIQGTGKSLSAKATASSWKLPLLRLDVGTLFGIFVGESEARTRDAIRLAEAMAPCVFWLDELDKAFAGVSSGFVGDSGTSARVFGTFITWMQEKTVPVFIAATANNVEGLPPELL